LKTISTAALGLSLLLGRTTPAAARAGGIVTDSCLACHSRGDAAPPALSLTSDPTTFNPGALVTFTLTVRAATMKVGGVFITTGGVGSLRALAGEGLRVDGQALTHSAPKASADGQVSFRFAWQAPAQAGGVTFGMAALAGNGNNTPMGDSAGSGEFQWTFGCAANTYYIDLDRDGYGTKSLGTRLGCAGSAPTGYATLDGDCDENDEKIHPGATEICNGRDDNCDTRVDEGATPVMMWPDRDGDGYYKAQAGTPKTGCADVPSYAAQGGDCDDIDPAVHPGAAETCNLRDDNCNGSVDERVRPRCGVGWCSRESLSCDPADCQPGTPAAETCNAFDDDCDGEIDNGACSAGGTTSGAGASGGAGLATGGPAAAGGSSPALPDAGALPGAASASREGGCAIAAALMHPSDASRANSELAIALSFAGCAAARRARKEARRVRESG
jgi:hypothetical protein